MKTLILAAGRGSRMRHLTEDRPKGLTPLDGIPLIERQRTALMQAGATEIGIVTGYLAEQLVSYGDATFHNPRWAETQMVSSLATAEAWLSAEPVIVSYSDIFYSAATVSALADATADLAITFDTEWRSQWEGRFDDPLLDAETFRLRDEGGTMFLTEIGRVPRAIDEIEGQYMGLLRFTPAGWRQIADARATLDHKTRDAQSMTELLDFMIARGARVQAIPTSDAWGEIDSVEDLAFFEGSHRPDA
ncbi:NTP transferase domain-containing protein [Jannaschia donghaensis]|uniref:UDP-N-acetylglucosamine diphosphorylase/glucosamine-1-phosphate N-acetyltransferase n=1 Tax=Jannaschia donghaensis TaxID=420998 RepID=A0A0M6YGH4_9RHOB|nr:phosphocholine cytidylyltransferase family protein [Jannaschia donghaensis]CTQ48879.1 UDP-N-acetylglucosamine diphosphorylase/glucosamine-1-phosphate N-acetyltransferase [Jannaschia donghaensis]